MNYDSTLKYIIKMTIRAALIGAGAAIATMAFFSAEHIRTTSHEDIHYKMKETCDKIGIYNFYLNGEITSVKCEVTKAKLEIVEVQN